MPILKLQFFGFLRLWTLSSGDSWPAILATGCIGQTCNVRRPTKPCLQSVVSHFGDWLHMDNPGDWGGHPWNDVFPTRLWRTQRRARRTFRSFCPPGLPEGPQLLFGPPRRARRQAPPKIPHLSLGDRRRHCQRGAPRGHRGGPGEPSDCSKMTAPGRCLLPLLSPCLFPVAGGCLAASGILGHTMHNRREKPSIYRLGGCTTAPTTTPSPFYFWRAVVRTRVSDRLFIYSFL